MVRAHPRVPFLSVDQLEDRPNPSRQAGGSNPLGETKTGGPGDGPVSAGVPFGPSQFHWSAKHLARLSRCLRDETGPIPVQTAIEMVRTFHDEDLRPIYQQKDW